MADPNTPAPVVNSSVAPDRLIVTIRYAVTLLSGLGLLSRFLTPEQTAFVKSDGFLTAASAVAGAAMIAWAWIEVKLKKVALVAATTSATPGAVVKMSLWDGLAHKLGALFGQ